jgi:hypothetical protein
MHPKNKRINKYNFFRPFIIMPACGAPKVEKPLNWDPGTPPSRRLLKKAGGTPALPGSSSLGGLDQLVFVTTSSRRNSKSFLSLIAGGGGFL